jgi:hypothetical protein
VRLSLFRNRSAESRQSRRVPITRPDQWCRLISVDPRSLDTFITRFGRVKAGTIQPGEWDLKSGDLRQHPKIVACLAHWVDGLSWRETGIIDQMREWAAERHGGIDGCRTEAEIVARYEKLDGIFEEVKREGRLRTSFELGRSASPHRERHGVMVHFGRDGAPIFGASGFHRLGMALSLGFERIPGCLGVVHAEAPAEVIDLVR